MLTRKAELLTAQFYAWELLGRGWLLSDHPVELEPPYTPFFGHILPSAPPADDGVRHTLLSGIASFFVKKKPVSEEPTFPDIAYTAFPFDDNSSLRTLRLILPKQITVSAAETEQLLVMLSYCKKPIAFEIVATSTTIILQVQCREEDARYVNGQIKTFFSQVTVLESETEYHDLFFESTPLAIVDYGLAEEFMRPLAQLRAVNIDPYSGIFSILEQLSEGERTIIQILFNGVLNYWPSSIIRSVSNKDGSAFFEDAPEMLPMAKEKVQSTLVAVSVRVAVQADTSAQCQALVQKLSFALHISSRSPGNSLTPLFDEVYQLEQRVKDMAFRESHRLGMLLNVKELATFVHLPHASLISKKLLATTRKTKSSPLSTEEHSLVLGINSHQGIEKQVTISSEQRLKHTHIIGATGTGKSTLLLSMICQDIQHGEGIAVLDPHGDLIEHILETIPPSRVRDVLLIDPSDSEYPVGFNILKAHSDSEKEVLSSDLVAVFKKLSTSWGDQMNSVFGNAILAFLESTTGGTLAELRRFLIEKSYREQFLRTVADPNITYYWQKEYPLLKTSSIGPILTRLDTFLRPRLIRNMVSQPGAIDFEQVLNTRKIMLVKLSQGLIGIENSFLLGSFVVSKIHQAALARQATEKRNNFFLYIDEFQHFITPSLAHMLSGIRKYHVGLVLAHQDLQQVQKNDAELLHTLLAVAGTRICFRVGDGDAKRLSEGLSFFDPPDLQNLHTGEAIGKIERQDYDFSLTVLPFEPSEHTCASKEAVMNHSRQTYSTSKQAVEDMLKEQMSSTPEETTEPPIHTPRSVATTKATAIPPQVAKTHKLNTDTVEIVKKKEETQHRYLQTLIKKVAESKGYTALIEAPTPTGKGRVDVLLQQGAQEIAVEVSVTTEVEWEMHNIQKCIQAGYRTVVVCTTDSKLQKALQEAVSHSVDTKLQSSILVMEPDELFSYLDTNTTEPPPTETTVKGYRVKVDFEHLSTEAMEKKRQSVMKVIVDSMKKMKK